MAGMQDFVGRRVKITLDDGLIVNGFLHSYGANDEKLSLEKVECIENGSRKKLVGLQHYFAEEITDIVVTEEVFKSKKHKLEAASRESQGGRSLMGKKYEPAHLRGLQNINYPSLVLKSKRQNDLLTSSGNETGSSGSDQDVLPQSDEYTIISKLSSTFYEAITYINKYQVIAVSTEGVVIGRAGKLCWLQIAVADHIFLFDVLNIGRACFDEGIKDLLENVDILKVSHDCRMISDMLHHQYDIRLVNVFDTQVANVFVYRLKHHQDWPRYVEGLSSCLVQHLNLSVDDVNWSVVRERKREEDEMVWMERPPQRHLVEAAVKNVKHLLELRMVLMEKMMEEFTAGVNIYLMHVRDANDTDASRYQTSPHLLPYAFQDLSAFMSSYKGRTSFLQTAKDPNGFRDNSYGITQPNVYFSRDSVWHAGKKKTETYESLSSKVTVPVSGNEHKECSSALKSSSLTKDSAVSEIILERREKKLATRKNLNSVSEMDAINQAVAKINLAKLSSEDCRKSKSQSAAITLTESLSLNAQSRAQPADDSDRELSGGRLMRALVYEQDKTGYECNSGMDLLSVIPAGKMVNGNCKTKKSRNFAQEAVIPTVKLRTCVSTPAHNHNHQIVNGDITPPQRPEYDGLEQVIPGGDIVAHSPPPRVGLSLQEKKLLQNMQQQSRSQKQYGSSGCSSIHESNTDSSPERVRRPSGQRCNILQLQLQGIKSSPDVYQSEPEGLSESEHNLRSTRHHHSILGQDNTHHHNGSESINTQQYRTPTTQHTSSISKLEILMQKLQKESI